MKLSDVIDSIKTVAIDGEIVDISEMQFNDDDMSVEVEDKSFTSCDSGDVHKDITLYIGTFDGKLIGFYA